MVNPTNGNGSNLINILRAEQGHNSSMQKLSSGRQINSFSDDPAGGSISVKMLSQTGGIQQSIMNDETNISLLQTKDSGLGEIYDNLSSIKTLQQSGANPAFGSEEKEAIQQQINSVLESTQNTIQSTTFNGKEVIKAGNELGKALENGISIDNTDIVDGAMEEVSSQRSKTGSEVNSLSSRVKSQLTELEELSSAESRIGDTDMAKEVMNNVSSRINLQTSMSLLKKSFSFNSDFAASILGL